MNRSGGGAGDVKALEQGVSAGQLTRDMPSASGSGTPLEKSDPAVVGGNLTRDIGRTEAPAINPSVGGTATRSVEKTCI